MCMHIIVRQEMHLPLLKHSCKLKPKAITPSVTSFLSSNNRRSSLSTASTNAIREAAIICAATDMRPLHMFGGAGFGLLAQSKLICFGIALLKNPSMFSALVDVAQPRGQI